MTILHILHADTLGGMEKFCIELCNSLSVDHDVYLMTDKIFINKLDHNVHFLPLDIKGGKNNPINLWKIFKLIRNIMPDIIHTHKQKSSYIIKRLYPFLQIPYVATKHDMAIKQVYNKIPYVISISEETTKTFNAPNIYKIYTAVAKKILTFSPKKEKIFTIIAIGGLRAVKGYNQLLNNIRLLTFDFQLWIVGEGEERCALEKLIEEYNLTKQVKLLGFRDDIPELLSKAHLQVICSYSEGFSLAMIEGIFYSDILLSTKVSGCIEVLPSELLMDIDQMVEKITYVYQNYDQYKSIFTTVKKTWSTFLEINYCKEQHVKIYSSIIDHHAISGTYSL